MTAPAKEFKFEIEDVATVASGKNWGGFIVFRVRASNGEKLEIFRTSTREKAAAWLQVYLTLSIPDRRKLREACTS